MGIIGTIKRAGREAASKVKDRIGRALVGLVVKGGWEGLFAIAKENVLFRDKLSAPYKQITNVFKAVKAIADNVPKAELIFKNWNNDEEIEPVDIIELFDKPNPFMSGADFNQAVAGYIALCGECVIVKTLSIGQVAGTRNLPSELWPFNPKKFREIKGRDMTTGREIITGWKYEGPNGTEYFSAAEVVLIKDWNPYNMFRGLAPVEVLEPLLEIDWHSLMFNKAFFENDASPGTVLTTDVSLEPESVARYREQWAKMHKGASKAHRVAVLDGGMKIGTTTNATHKDMDFIEQKKFVREEILGVWRAPKALFNITEDLNYATFVGQMKIFWLYGIMPILEKMGQSYTNQIIRPYDQNIYCEFDASKAPAFQEDFKDKVETAKKLMECGFTRNEVNEKLKLGFDDNEVWGDKYLVPFGMVDVEDVLNGEFKDEEETPPAADPEDDEEKQQEAREVSVTKTMSEKDKKVWGGFLKQHIPNEIVFQKAVKRYFFLQRGRILAAIDEQMGNKSIKISFDFRFDWEFEKDLFRKKVNPHLQRAAKGGATFAASLLASELNPELVERLIARVVGDRTNKAVTIIDTQSKLVNKAIEEGLQEGNTISEIASSIKDNIRKVYNNAASRARVIARTETTAAMNTTSEYYYKEAGVKRKEWLTAGDEAVRESHKNLNGDIVDIDEQFDNGLMHPGGEGPAGEVINCRCTLQPVIE